MMVCISKDINDCNKVEGCWCCDFNKKFTKDRDEVEE